MKQNKLKLLDENDLFINTKTSDSQMFTLKLDMQLFTDNSMTIETNSDTILYGMLIILLTLSL